MHDIMHLHIYSLLLSQREMVLFGIITYNMCAYLTLCSNSYFFDKKQRLFSPINEISRKSSTKISSHLIKNKRRNNIIKN